MKRATNLTVEEDLLAEARAHGINLSETLEVALRRRLADAKSKKWLAENMAAIRKFNDAVARSGTFGEQILADEE